MFRLKRIRLSGADVVAEHDLIRAEAKRKEQLSPEGSQRHAAGAVVLREDIVVATRVVELTRARAHDHVVVGQLTEVDARLVDLQIDRALRRKVAHEQDGQSFAGHLVHRTERQAVAVREGQSLVDPGAIRQARRVQLARRQHHLTELAVDDVAIVVDRHEVVVGADLLDLSERLEQRLVIPEPDVLERGRIVRDVVARQQRIAGQRTLLDVLEAERTPRRRDVVLDERRLAHLLVGRDDETLQDGAVDLAADRRRAR